MIITEIKKLANPDIKVIRFERNNDFRGYFSETFNANDFKQKCSFFNDFSIKQANESFSFANTFRGLHIQPNMGKLVRLVYGSMIDFALDLRKESKFYRKIVAYGLYTSCDYAEWIWLPPGFAHGMWLKQNSMVEYFCTETYDANEQYCVPIFSEVVDWEICDKSIYDDFFAMDKGTLKIKESDLICSYDV